MKTTSHSRDCRAHGVPTSLKKQTLPILLLIVSIFIPLSGMAEDGGRSVTAIADTQVYAYSYRNWNRANLGAYDRLDASWNPTGGEKRSYLNFDLSELNPGPADKVKLRLYQFYTSGDATRELTIHEVTAAWIEGTGTYHSGSVEPDAATGEISWESQPPFAPEIAARFSPGPTAGQFVEVDVTDLVQGWLGGRPNHGMVITAPDRSGAAYGHSFHSREYEDADKRPALVIGSPVVQEPPVEGLTCSVQSSPTPLATLEWDSAPGDLFRVLYSSDFSTWHDDLPGSLITGLAGQSSASFTDQIDSLDRRYYSVIRVTTQ